MRQCRFADSGKIFDEQMAARDQASDRQPKFAAFTEDDIRAAVEDATEQALGFGRRARVELGDLGFVQRFVHFS